MKCISFSIFLWKWKTNGVLKIQCKTLLKMKMVVKYLNFVFHIEAKTKCNYNILNFVFQFMKNTKSHFRYTDFFPIKSQHFVSFHQYSFLCMSHSFNINLLLFTTYWLSWYGELSNIFVIVFVFPRLKWFFERGVNYFFMYVFSLVNYL